MEIMGITRDGVIVLDSPADVPDGTRVVVHFPSAAATVASETQSLGKRLLKHAGTVDGLPTDLAEQHDHYLHGTPKR